MKKYYISALSATVITVFLYLVGKFELSDAIIIALLLQILLRVNEE